MHVHGDNLSQKERHQTKYTDSGSRRFLKEIRKEYDRWRSKNELLKGPHVEAGENDGDILAERIRLFVEYKDFVDQQKYAEKFDSRSNLHSSVLEEFMFYLFRDMVFGFSEHALLGKAHAFKDVFFDSPNFREMVSCPHARIEIKDHDFVIGVNVLADMQVAGSTETQKVLLQIPAVAVECKTYLDKTMLEGASTAAEQLKMKNPNGMYIVVSEWLKLTSQVNLGKYKVDQVYVLRKQKNTDREFRYLESYEKNPIHVDVVEHLFNSVRKHLTSDWEKGVEYGLSKGYLL